MTAVIFSKSGSKNATERNLIDRVEDMRGRFHRPFASTSQEVLRRLSAKLVAKRETPQFAALGFWLRPAETLRLKKDFFSGVPNNSHAIARGISFHLPPNNVDTLFVYSWALSFLAGNANIVRLPSLRSQRLVWLIDTLIEILEDTGEIDRHIFCSYNLETALNKEISKLADLRIIWGGDAKVNAVSTLP